MIPEINQSRKEDYRLYGFFPCFTFFIFFTRLSEIFPILAKVHINLFSFSITLGLVFFSGAYSAVKWRKNEAVTLILLFLFVGLFSVPFAVWPRLAFSRWKELLLIHNTVLIFFCLAAIHNEKQLMCMVYTFLVSASLLTAALLINPRMTLDGRLSVTYAYDANDIALILAVSFPLFFSQFLISRMKGKIMLAILMFFIVFGILKTGSRGGQLALSVGVLCILFSSKIKLRFLYKALVVFFIGAFLLSFQADQLKERWASVVSGEDYNISNVDDVGGGRLAIWRSGIELFSENFMIGVGVGNSSTAMGERFGQYGWMTIHNTYLQAALELGIGGIIVLILMLRSIWCNCSQVIKKYAEQSLNKRIFILVYYLRISLVTFMVASFFLSQAYSIIIPFFLIIANRLKFLAQKA